MQILGGSRRSWRLWTRRRDATSSSSRNAFRSSATGVSVTWAARTDGLLSRIVAAAHPHLQCVSFDLPAVTEIARRKLTAEGLGERVQACAGDFLADPLPAADVITMGQILHDWNLDRKQQLVAKAYEALSKEGAFIVIETLIDDARRENTTGLMMSLNMLIEFGDAFDYSAADFRGWCGEAGFRSFEVIPLAGGSSAAVAYK